MKKKTKVEEPAEEIFFVPTALIDETKVILPLAVDFPSEGLNNMAKKINEIIEKINTL